MTRTIGRVLILLIALTTPAHADWHGHGGGWGGHWGGGWGEHEHWGWGGGDYGDVGGGFLGGVVGGVLGGLFTRPEPSVVVVPAVPEMVPNTPAWYAYCANKYRSFNAQTGTYLGFDGRLHACQ